MATVTVDLEKYLELKKFKDEHPKSYIRVSSDRGFTDRTLITTEQAVKIITETNLNLEQDVWELMKKVAQLKYDLEKIKKMSVLGFLKWRAKDND